MGWGDELIITGQARRLQQNGARGKVVVYDRKGCIREHPAWIGNPRVATRSDRLTGDTARLDNGPGLRPYILSKTVDRWTWKEWECPVGELYLTPDEVGFAAQHRGHVVIEPNLKGKASPNKDWGGQRWVELVQLLRSTGVTVVQLGDSGTRTLPGVRLIETPTFRQGCAVLANASAAILTEGGLHHAAAALGVKSVVIFGGYISPKQTGYATQTNLFTGGVPCGERNPCPHCAKAMRAITPQQVFEEYQRL